jgi:predicted RNase H-like nuclease
VQPVIGVDGCPAGWIAVIWSDSVEHRLCRTFQEILKLGGSIIAVDMPIGFQDIDTTGGREAERIVRRLLKGRTSSVFPTPSRAVVEADPVSRKEACKINGRHSRPRKSIGCQTFNIIRKMAEIDRLMTVELQDRVHEAHPELAFWAMNDRQVVRQSKKSSAGRSSRISLLANAGFPISELPLPTYRRADVGLDDLIDACACACVARRILAGRHIRFPTDPPRDARGLRMEINA